MPVRQLKAIHSPDHAALVKDLLQEWNHPGSGNTEPVIVEDRGPDGRLVHLYVIWSQWERVDGTERSEIIMDAAEKRLSTDELTNITMAMGLTADEARRMGIAY